uniref:EF-hand domain-containing protein n=1 Tax=Cryptomonas curvata TaxID=233186 RepID=A0A7S0MZJ9_9CRYP|mmetsp:Transcript_58293/g.121786  ORF Transcript_58293/g.121786 Transcript_58293/m.121786 type:complete len:170 (+) Transcript_58293:2-511(+)
MANVEKNELFPPQIMPRHLTEDQVEHFRDAFKLFDTDGGGSIDAEELGACLRSLGRNLSEAEIHEMIVQWDLDDKGTISFEGFLAMISSLTAVMDIEKELHSAFQEFDNRQCGRMSKEDFIAIFTMKTAAYETPVQRGEVENLIQSFNALDPRTGEVDYDLFIHRMLRC